MNDAPALKKANVGIAVAGATAAAKGAADIIFTEVRSHTLAPSVADASHTLFLTPKITKLINARITIQQTSCTLSVALAIRCICSVSGCLSNRSVPMSLSLVPMFSSSSHYHCRSCLDPCSEISTVTNLIVFYGRRGLAPSSQPFRTVTRSFAVWRRTSSTVSPPACSSWDSSSLPSSSSTLRCRRGCWC